MKESKAIDLILKETTRLTVKKNMRRFGQPEPPMNILKDLPPDHEYIWQNVQRRRREGDPLMLGGRAIRLTKSQKELQEFLSKNTLTWYGERKQKETK